MYSSVRQFAVFHRIRAANGEARLAEIRYFNKLENARKVALCDCMAAAATVSDAEAPSNCRPEIPAADIFVGRVDLPLLVLLEKERGNNVQITANAAGYSEIKLGGAMRKPASPPDLYLTEVTRLTYDEFGEIAWTPTVMFF